MEEILARGDSSKVLETRPNSRVTYRGEKRTVFAYEDKYGAHLLVHPSGEEEYTKDAFDRLIAQLKESRDPLGHEAILPALMMSYGFEKLEFGMPQRVESHPQDPQKVRIVFSDDLILEVPLGETIILPYL